MSIGWTVALVIAGVMSGGGMVFCCLALVVSGRQAEERAKRERAERIRRADHQTTIDDMIRLNEEVVDNLLTDLQRARYETQIARAVTREIFFEFEKMRDVLVEQDPLRWNERVSIERRAASIREKLKGSANAGRRGLEYSRRRSDKERETQ